MKLTTLFFVFLISICTQHSGQTADLEVEKELANETGWRAAHWRINVANLASLFGKDFQEQKRKTDETKVNVSIRGKLKTKLVLDGLEYEVKFGFSPEDRLNAIYLICNKAKQHSAGALRQRLAESYGQIHSYERIYGRVGVAIHPDIQEMHTWRNGPRLIELHSLEIRPNIFMWVRRFAVIVKVPESQQDFGDNGLRSFGGEVRQIRIGKAARWCRLEVNPARKSLKAICQKDEVILDDVLAVEDGIQLGQRSVIGDLEVQQLAITTTNRLVGVDLVVGADVVSLLQSTFREQIK